MNLKWRQGVIVLLVILLCGAAASMALGAPQKVTFTDDEKQIINEYYKHQTGAIAPGSIDRNPLPFNMEQGLKVGVRLAISLEKRIERLPDKLESNLPLHGAEYKRYHVGNHVILLRTTDRIIVDIIRNAGMR